MAGHALYLHAGAHRTGSSSLQMCLSLNKPVIQAAGFGVLYPGRDGIADGRLKVKFPLPRIKDHAPFVERAARQMHRHADGKPLVMSEENISGRMLHMQKGQFYARVVERCRIIRDAWGGPIGKVLYVTRQYDSFLVSGYKLSAMGRARPPFAELRDVYFGMERGWPEVIAAVRDTLQPAEMEVVDYAVRGSSAKLAARLVPGVSADQLEEPTRRVNLSGSDAALGEIQRRYRAGEELSDAVVEEIIHTSPDGAGHFELIEFSQDDKQAWYDRYQADLDVIGQMSGVTLVR